MDANEKTPEADKPRDAEPEVAPKQVHRWKDDGGAIADESDVERDLPEA